MPKVDLDNIWELVPSVSVGNIKFGDPIDIYIKKYQLIKLDEVIDGIDWDTYQFPNRESRIYVENNCVGRIGCFDELFFQGTNLMGITYSGLQKVIGFEDETGEEIDGGIPLEYYRYGIQVWLVSESLIVDAIMCDGEDDE